MMFIQCDRHGDRLQLQPRLQLSCDNSIARIKHDWFRAIVNATVVPIIQIETNHID